MRTSGSALVGVCIVAVAFGGCAGISPSSRRHVASARALVIQPDGKIVAAGTAGIGNRIAFALARYLPDGALDPAFGTGGTVTTFGTGGTVTTDFGGVTGR